MAAECLGSHRTISGMYVHTMSAANRGTSQGNIAIVVRSTDSFAVRDSTNSTVPRGGGRGADLRLRTHPRPQGTRASPRFWHSGPGVGARGGIAAPAPE